MRPGEYDMKTIGLLGGMSWESTALYYRLINELTRERLGGLHSAPIAMVSMDFAPLEELQHAGDWKALARSLSTAARQVEAAGADVLLICTNTMHRVAGEIQDAIGIPVLHIADATSAAIKADGFGSVGLLGTSFTMEEAFYRERVEASGIRVLVPDAGSRQEVHRVIYDELCQGIVSDVSRDTYLDIMGDLEAAGAEGIIAGCTEIGMLVGQADTDMPLLDSTEIHARAAVEAAMVP